MVAASTGICTCGGRFLSRWSKDLLGRVTSTVMRDGRRFTVEVSSDGAGLVSHGGSGLLATVADQVV